MFVRIYFYRSKNNLPQQHFFLAMGYNKRGLAGENIKTR